jgi:hypothetical protein
MVIECFNISFWRWRDWCVYVYYWYFDGAASNLADIIRELTGLYPINAFLACVLTMTRWNLHKLFHLFLSIVHQKYQLCHIWKVSFRFSAVLLFQLLIVSERCKLQLSECFWIILVSLCFCRTISVWDFSSSQFFDTALVTRQRARTLFTWTTSEPV